MTSPVASVLSIAGSDSSGGAGIQADLKTLIACGVYGMSAITSLTAQNTTGVFSTQNTSIGMLDAQIRAVFDDIRPDAVKVGMIPTAPLVDVVARRLDSYAAANVVVDTVMISSSGTALIDRNAIDAADARLLPLATLITPNIAEAQTLLGLKPGSLGDPAAMEDAALALSSRYGTAILLKGGHSAGNANDVLADRGRTTWFTSPRIDNPNTHGTGCTLSSAIAAGLATGLTLPEAVASAKAYTTGAIAAGLDLGQGNGPMDHAWRWHNEEERRIAITRPQAAGVSHRRAAAHDNT
ncbi:MAG: bifunctional hydroxymethylpyrimidine kinase/phosphomethylpyrimidine kinase [Bifidobacterium sp.]|jgi:hydroxymethylpyrimidine/phosphomethylpyrimidine kinase|nr:bifunctional hydroxymethylpyrimidine kinase/phosphomethylpyrimidine kinase [Bifidobacterium sp.]MCI1865601.1 bifunctional hydroxymethylpyrimidine kinase/phosphomethylpyrimidine kinase [Bifidobacterium sp.]